MPDEPLYDPDSMVPEDLDFSDIEVAQAYLDHPATRQLVEDLGKSFRHEPVEIQRKGLMASLARFEGYRADVVQAIKERGDIPPEDPIYELRDAIEGHIAAFEARLRELA